MRDYSKLSKKKKVEIGNEWLKKNEINDLEFTTVRKDRKLNFALVWITPNGMLFVNKGLRKVKKDFFII